MWRRLAGRVFPAIVNCGCLAVGGATFIAQAGAGCTGWSRACSWR